MPSHIIESSPASSSGEIQGVYLLWPKKSFPSNSSGILQHTGGL